MRNRNNIIAKTLLKLAALNPSRLNKLIQEIETQSSVEFIHGKIKDFILKDAKKEDDAKVVYNRLSDDRMLQRTPIKDALKLIAKEFPHVVS